MADRASTPHPSAPRRELTRRSLLRTAGAAAAALSVTASGLALPRDAQAAATPSTPYQPNLPHLRRATTLNLLSWSSFVPDEDEWLKGPLVDWARGQGIDLNVELINSNDVQPKIVAALQAGAGPDIAQMQWNWPHLYADKLTDVSDLAGPAGTAGGGWYPASQANCQVSGTWRAVPFAMTGNATAYRKSYLMQGTGSNKTPSTWDEYTQIGTTVRAQTGYWVGQAVAHSFGDPPTFVYPFLWSYGGSETDESGKLVTIRSQETANALMAFKTWFDACSDQQCLSWDDSSNNRAFLAGQIWATNNGASIYAAATKQDQEMAADIEHFLLPAGPKGQFLLAFPYGWGIPTYSSNAPAARDVISYLVNPDTYKFWMQQGKGYTLAPYKRGESDLWPAGDPKYEAFKTIGNVSKWYGYPAAPSAAAAEAASKYITIDMFAKVIQGDSPDSAMTWAEGELKQVYRV